MRESVKKVIHIDEKVCRHMINEEYMLWGMVTPRTSIFLTLRTCQKRKRARRRSKSSFETKREQLQGFSLFVWGDKTHFLCDTS